MSQKYIGGFITKSPTLPDGPYETSVAKGVWTLDQAMQFKKQGLWPTAGNIAPPTVIGQAYGGGYYAGQIGVSGVATHYIIVGPLSSATSVLKWKNTNTAATGADSVINGPQNTADMVADGSSTVYPAAHFCNDLVVGSFSDWYLPAKNELEVCYYNLKPTTSSNNTSQGTNTNAVPSRGSNYTSGDPAQTSATDFRNTGTQNFNAQTYWTSTDVTSYGANTIDFGSGNVYVAGKAYTNNVRAIRRIAV